MSVLKNVWVHGDCLKNLQTLKSESVDLIITSPPYHNLRVYSNDPSDLSNCETYEEYYYLLSLVIEECHRVLKPAGKFAIQFEDYNYTLGRDGKRGKESLVGDINKIFKDKNFTLWTEVIWHKYTPQRAMLSDGALWYRNLKNRDTQVAANWGYVYVYRKDGQAEEVLGADITLEEWATWADGVWHISNSGIGHTTPFAEELVRRIIKLWSMPNDTVLDPFAGAGTVNHVAIKNKRNAIGFELKKEFYDLAIEKRFSTYTDADYALTYDKSDVTANFIKEKQLAEEGKERAKQEVEEKKTLMDVKNKVKSEIKKLEAELLALNVKKSEIKKLKEDAN